MKQQRGNYISYILWMLIVASVFASVSYYFFKDISGDMVKTPWVFVGFFLFPFAYVLSTTKDLRTLDECIDITETENSRLRVKISFAKKFLLSVAIITIIFAVFSGMFLYYATLNSDSVKYVIPFVMSLVGIDLYLVYSLWNLNSSINDFKMEVTNRKKKRTLELV